MKTIASFQIDHTRLRPGVYVSRRDKVKDGYLTTFDVRLKRPNVEPAIHPNALHTIEHIIATYLRNSSFGEHVVYWGPMGCLTGCYFITNTAERIGPRDVAKLLKEAFSFLAAFEGEVPGARERECGNFRLHDLAMAKLEAAKFIKAKWRFEYPK